MRLNWTTFFLIKMFCSWSELLLIGPMFLDSDLLIRGVYWFYLVLHAVDDGEDLLGKDCETMAVF